MYLYLVPRMAEAERYRQIQTLFYNSRCTCILFLQEQNLLLYIIQMYLETALAPSIAEADRNRSTAREVGTYTLRCRTAGLNIYIVEFLYDVFEKKIKRRWRGEKYRKNTAAWRGNKNMTRAQLTKTLYYVRRILDFFGFLKLTKQCDEQQVEWITCETEEEKIF